MTGSLPRTGLEWRSAPAAGPSGNPFWKFELYRLDRSVRRDRAVGDARSATPPRSDAAIIVAPNRGGSIAYARPTEFEVRTQAAPGSLCENGTGHDEAAIHAAQLRIRPGFSAACESPAWMVHRKPHPAQAPESPRRQHPVRPEARSDEGLAGHRQGGHLAAIQSPLHRLRSRPAHRELGNRLEGSGLQRQTEDEAGPVRASHE